MKQALLAAVFLFGCETGDGGCCKVCTTGKPCGDSCIAKTSQCTKGAGCACLEAEAEREDESDDPQR